MRLALVIAREISYCFFNAAAYSSYNIIIIDRQPTIPKPEAITTVLYIDYLEASFYCQSLYSPALPDLK